MSLVTAASDVCCEGAVKYCEDDVAESWKDEVLLDGTNVLTPLMLLSEYGIMPVLILRLPVFVKVVLLAQDEKLPLRLRGINEVMPVSQLTKLPLRLRGIRDGLLWWRCLVV